MRYRGSVGRTFEDAALLPCVGPHRALGNVVCDVVVDGVVSEVECAGNPVGPGLGVHVVQARQKQIVIIVAVHPPGEHELLVVVHAGDGLATAFRLRQGRQEQGSQNGDNGDDDQQFDQRKGTTAGLLPGETMDPARFSRLLHASVIF